MKYSRIPKTSLDVSQICLGTWVFGGDMWGGADDKDSLSAFSAAMDYGVNFIDTAPIYGFGKSEEVIGRAIRGKRSEIILATKCGLEFKDKRVSHNLSPKFIREEIDNSLRRLQTDYIDIYQIHWPDPATPLEETLRTLNDIKAQGKIKYIGVSNFDEKLIKQACQMSEIVTLQNQYSLLERQIESSIIPECLKQQVSLLCYGPLAGGILSGKYQKNPHFKKSDSRNFFYKFYSQDQFPKSKAFADCLEKIGKPLSQVAINWLLQQQGVTSVIVGCRNAQQVCQNMETLTWSLSPADFDIINQASREFFHA